MGAYYLHPQDARAIFLHNDLPCNDTCSVTGGGHNILGGTNVNNPRSFFLKNISFKKWPLVNPWFCEPKLMIVSYVMFTSRAIIQFPLKTRINILSSIYRIMISFWVVLSSLQKLVKTSSPSQTTNFDFNDKMVFTKCIYMKALFSVNYCY